MGSGEHILLLPYMAHGHLIPFLALAKQIQQSTGFTITIANTKLNIQYLRSTLSSSDSNSNIYFAELPFCSTDHDLPPNTENTENLSLTKIGTLFHASASLKEPLLNLVRDIKDQEGKPPLCIISDVFFGWANEVAKSVGTVNITFTTGGAYGTLAYASVWLNLPHRSSDSDEFTTPGFPESYRFHRSQLHQYIRDADGTDTWSRFMQSQISKSMESYGWLCNTVEEIEPLGLDLLRKYLGLPVWSIGPLIPPAALKNNQSCIYKQHTGKKPGLAPEKCVEWLDLHCPDSVLYISFGSQNTIGWPMAAEQAYNSKMLIEEMGVSVEITRGSQGVVVGKEVKRVIELALDKEGKGKDMRNKAAKAKEQLRAAVKDEGEDKGSSVKAMNDFVRTLLSKRQEQSDSIEGQKFMVK
ncbi:UDP-glycosyltransferase 92A1-like [Fagus crenata]